MLNFRRKPPLQAKIGAASFTISSVNLIHLHHQQHGDEITFLIASSALVVSISTFFLFVEPIPQSQTYHNFADKRVFICSCHAHSEGFFLPPGSERRRRHRFLVPNFGDVISNIFIFAGGMMGAILLQFAKQQDNGEDIMRQWQLNVCLPILFYSTILISIGSTYYHWNPTDKSLVWDRLPMTLAFVSTFCFMLEEYIPDVGCGRILLFPLMGVGIFSIAYWRWSDDLRLYAMVQFLPPSIITGLLVWSDPQHGGKHLHTTALISYALAKHCEDRDYEIFEMTGQRVSGHSLKHALAGLSSVMIALGCIDK
jgi:hypothetical protein